MAITSTKLVDDNFKIMVNANGVGAEEDQKIVDRIEQGDQIQTIKIVGEYEELLSSVESVSEWNDVLDSDSDS